MSRYYEGNLAKKIITPYDPVTLAPPKIRRIRRRKISIGKIISILILLPIIVAMGGVCYTAKRAEIAATSYQLEKLKNDLEILRDAKSRLEVSILTKKAEIDFTEAQASNLAMHAPTVADVSIVQ